MGARTTLLIATLVVALSGCASPSADAPAPTQSAVTAEESMSTDAQTSDSTQGSVDAATDVQSEGAGPGAYVSFSEYEAARDAFAATDVVLFFNADWCSTCKEARDNIQADLASIPSDLTIVVVDFDAANDLRQKYGVTVQHTFVQIDADGKELAKWSGSVTADEIAQNTV